MKNNRLAIEKDSIIKEIQEECEKLRKKGVDLSKIRFTCVDGRGKGEKNS